MRPMDWSKYIGIPFKHAGRDYNGVDCYGLVYLVLRDTFALHPPLYTAQYPAEKDRMRQSQRMHDALSTDMWVRVTETQPGDMVVFDIHGWPGHVGVLVDKKSFVHSMKNTESCAESLDSPLWKPRIRGFYRCAR